MSDSPYAGTRTALVKPSGNFLLDVLIGGSKWGSGPAGTGAQLTFAFPTSTAAYDTAAGVAGNYNLAEPMGFGIGDLLDKFGAFDAFTQTATRKVLAAWAQVANISFTEVAASDTAAGDLRFAYSGPPVMDLRVAGLSGFPQDVALAGDTWINGSTQYPDGWAPGSHNFLTLLHEVGHSLGLKHPFDTGYADALAGWPDTEATLDTSATATLRTNSSRDTVMAYNDVPGLSAPVADFAPTTPMRMDITALQWLYGPNTRFNDGDTTYIYDGDKPYNETLWDAGGRDTIVATGSRPVLIDLTPGSWSQLGLPLTFSTRFGDLTVARPRPDLTAADTVYIYDTVFIENAVGGSGNDRLVGNALANRLQGGAGDDDIDGTGGVDTAVFSGARAGYSVELSEGAWRVADRRGSDGRDTLHNVERLQFSDTGLALDTRPNDAAGQVAAVIRALFGSTWLKIPAVVGIGLSLIDQGMSLESLVGTAIATPEFTALAGSASNTDFVRLLYTHVVGQPPAAAELARYVALLDNGSFTQTGLGMLACKDPINTQSVDLVGLAYVGLEYLLPAG